LLLITFRTTKVCHNRTNENVLNEINETRKILSTIKERRWNIIDHVLGHEEELLHIIIEGKMNGKGDRGRLRTSYIKRTISDAGLANYKELKRLAENRDEWRNFGKPTLGLIKKKKKLW